MTIGNWHFRDVFLNERLSVEKSKPTMVNSRGIYYGYSMPIWNGTSNIYEELYFSMTIPENSWDKVTPPIFSFLGYLPNAEAANSNIKFQLECDCVDYPCDVPNTIACNVTDERNIGTRNNQYSSHFFRFEVPPGTLCSGNWQARLRRVAATSDDIAGEFVVLHWRSEWFMTKPYQDICDYLAVFT